MTKLHHEVKINAPVGKVWGVLADLESVRFTNPLVKTVKIISPNKEGLVQRVTAILKTENL